MSHYLKQAFAKNDSRGFSLVELLIVVGIIGVMAAIALPQYFRLTDNAIKAEGVILMNYIEKEATVFYAFNDYYPDFDDMGEIIASIDPGGEGGFFAQGVGGFFANGDPPPLPGPEGDPHQVLNTLFSIVPKALSNNFLMESTTYGKTFYGVNAGSSAWYVILEMSLDPDKTLRQAVGAGAFPLNSPRVHTQSVQMLTFIIEEGKSTGLRTNIYPIP